MGDIPLLEKIAISSVESTQCRRRGREHAIDRISSMGQRREHAIDRMPATGQRREHAIDRMPATGQRRTHTQRRRSRLY
jgi:hypothetical protein